MASLRSRLRCLLLSVPTWRVTEQPLSVCVCVCVCACA
jgi:hypothetical protein